MSKKFLKKIEISLFIFVFLTNSVPLTAWGAVVDNVQEEMVNEEISEDNEDDQVLEDTLEDDEDESDKEEDEVVGEDSIEDVTEEEMDDSDDVSNEEGNDEASIEESEDKSLVVPDDENLVAVEEIVLEKKEKILEVKSKEVKNLEILKLDKVKQEKVEKISEELFVEEVKNSPSVEYSGVIFINEVMVDSSDENKEWVELYNAGNDDVDLTDWMIKDAVNDPKSLVDDNAVEAGSVIPAGGFYVFEFFPEDGNPIKGWLNNDASSNETVTIYDFDGYTVDNVEVKSNDGKYPGEDQTTGRLEDGSSDWILFSNDGTTKGKSNVPTGTIIFKSYVCPFDVSINNDYRPKSDGSVDGSLDECVLKGEYNMGHGGDVISLSPAQTKNWDGSGVSVGTTINGYLEVELEAGRQYMFGQLGGEDRFIGFGDDKLYSDEVLGFACNNSPINGFRDNNAEAFTLSKGETAYCNLYESNIVSIPDTPDFLGFNEQGSSNIGDIPPYHSCGVVVNGENKLSGTWTDVSASGVNVSYIRHNVRPNGASDILLDGKIVKSLASTADSENLNILTTMPSSYSSNNTGSWGGFGANEGLYHTRVRAFSDIDSDGKYDVGEPISEWSKDCEITYDATAPIVNVDMLATNDNTPELTGTIVDDPDAIIIVRIEGVDYTAVNNGDGTWTLADDSISPALADGVYDVVVFATDLAGNVGYDFSIDELFIDATAPVLTEVVPIDSPTNDSTPEYTFDSDEVGAITYGGSCASLTDVAVVGNNIISFEYLEDGVYSDCTITVTDALGNVSDVLNVSEFVVDTEKPTASQLADQIFNEGDDVPLVTVNGKDNFEVDEFCFSVVDQDSNQLVSESCDSFGSGVSYDWNTLFGLPSIFDTSMVPEGIYTINYYVKDAAGNASDNYLTNYILNNVAPNVTFVASDDDIDEDDKISFTGSFTDPSSRDAGDNVFDDSDWYAIINYGEGDDVSLGTFSNEFSISIPDHKYKHDGDFVAKLTVCEAKDNVSSENICTTEEISIEVDDTDKKKDDDGDEIINPAVIYNNFVTSYVPSSNIDEQDEYVSEKILEDDEKEETTIKVRQEPKVSEGIVAGEQVCQDKWPVWAWILLFVAAIGLMSLIGYVMKNKDENVSRIFWQVALIIITLLIWYFVDVCRSCVWVPVLTVIGGAVITIIFYKGEDVSRN